MSVLNTFLNAGQDPRDIEIQGVLNELNLLFQKVQLGKTLSHFPPPHDRRYSTIGFEGESLRICVVNPNNTEVNFGLVTFDGVTTYPLEEKFPMHPGMEGLCLLVRDHLLTPEELQKAKDRASLEVDIDRQNLELARGPKQEASAVLETMAAPALTH